MAGTRTSTGSECPYNTETQRNWARILARTAPNSLENRFRQRVTGFVVGEARFAGSVPIPLETVTSAALSPNRHRRFLFISRRRSFRETLDPPSIFLLLLSVPHLHHHGLLSAGKRHRVSGWNEQPLRLACL
ncbi:hypothetical protein L1987_18725 [Smallanthus sonchifolius]|uniref:Uncharacterized protein n=1 Tax=Smallanthus sonchifolius TaxID=185202 RepID=A0ACB9J3Z7_9ASTR|nr:hypothetical protein L1987_18725 [Smallanthus sonchifolius]